MKQRVAREPAYWAAVPAPVRHDKKLSANAKLLYAEISALATKRGYCWAENEYFATLYDLSVRTISGLISKLAKKKYVTVQILRDPNTNEVIERRIWIIPLPAEEQTPPEENFHTPPEGNCVTPHEKNFQENVYNPGSNIPPKAPQRGKRPSKYDLAEDAKPVLRAYCTNYPELYRPLADLIEIRVAKKAINSKRAIVTLLNEIDRLSDGRREDKLLLVRQSVANSWKSVFPLKGGGAPAPAAPVSPERFGWD